MLTRLQKLLMHRLCLRESWVIFFILGLIMMNYPFISIFSKNATILGFPLLYLYLFIGWLVSIFIIFLFTKAMALCERLNDKERP